MENIALIRVVQDHYVGHSKVFLDRQGHLGEVLCHLEAFETIRNAREASGAQRCECSESDTFPPKSDIFTTLLKKRPPKRKGKAYVTVYHRHFAFILRWFYMCMLCLFKF